MNEQERAAPVDLATKGDIDALQRLIVHYHRPLRTALQGKMDPPVRQHIDAEDVLQEVYPAAFKTITDCNFQSPATRTSEKMIAHRLRRAADLRSNVCSGGVVRSARSRLVG